MFGSWVAFDFAGCLEGELDVVRWAESAKMVKDEGSNTGIILEFRAVFWGGDGICEVAHLKSSR